MLISILIMILWAFFAHRSYTSLRMVWPLYRGDVVALAKEYPIDCLILVIGVLIVADFFFRILF